METITLSPNVYRTAQVNGQRITVNHILNSEGEGYEVFIGHLPRDMNESEILPVLMSVGLLRELRIMMNFSGLNRGFAFARFGNKESAENAVRYLNNFEIRSGRRIAVIESTDKKKLFIGRFGGHLKGDTVARILRNMTENIVNIEQRSYSSKLGMDDFYCVVEYKTHRDACKARRILVLSGREVFQSQVVVDWAFVENTKLETYKNRHQQREILTNQKFNNQKFNDMGSTLVAKMKELNIRETKSQRKVGGRRSIKIEQLSNRSDGTASPTGSVQSDENSCQQRRKKQRNGRKVFMWNETGTVSQRIPIAMKLGIVKATMVECQLCGPRCTFNRTHKHAKTVGAERRYNRIT